VTQVKPVFWKPQNLKDHGDRDFGSGSARYEQWHRDGHIETSPGRAIDPAVVANKIAEVHNRYHSRSGI
jgi:phage terminase large subunit-like protein